MPEKKGIRMPENTENMSEAKLTDLAMLEYPHCFRNDCGQGYQGGIKKIAKSSGPIHVEHGDVVIINPTPVKYGLHVGSGDLFGGTPVVVTEKLLGKTILVATSVEVKTLKDKPSRDQIIWYFNIMLSGGIAVMLHCNKKLSIEEILSMSRRSEKTKEAKEAKDKIINNLYSEYKRRRGIS